MNSSSQQSEDEKAKQTEFAPAMCNLKPFKRNKYFYGKLMTVSDFNLEQQYLNEKRHLINRFIHGVGAVCGLEVSSIRKEAQKDGQEVWKITITKGFALDCCGREIILVNKKDEMECELTIQSEFVQSTAGKKIGLYLRRLEYDTDPIFSPSNSSLCEDIRCFSHTEEKYGLFYEVFEPTPSIRFDKFSYRVKDTVHLDLIDIGAESSSSRQEPQSLQLVSTEDTKGISLSLQKGSNGTFSAEATLTQEPSDPANKLLKVESEKGDIITAQYNNNLQEKSFAIVLGSDDRKIANDYYKTKLVECRYCDDKIDRNTPPKVLLAVIENRNGYLMIDREQSWIYRETVYNNTMLYDLITHHMFDRNNPHDVTAEQLDLGPVSMTDSGCYTAERGRVAKRKAGDKEDGDYPVYVVSEKIKYHTKFLIPPSVNLGKWNEDEQTVEYMEDLAIFQLFPKKPIRSSQSDPNTPKWIDEYFENDPVIFKAIDVDKDGFRIMTIWSSNSKETDTLTIRWWATSTVNIGEVISSQT